MGCPLLHIHPHLLYMGFERLVLFCLRPAGGGRLAKKIRQHHRGGVRHHCPATSAAEGDRGENRRKIQLIANGGLSRRPWTGWRNRLKVGGGGSGSNMMISMPSMQMQQQCSNFQCTIRCFSSRCRCRWQQWRSVRRQVRSIFVGLRRRLDITRSVRGVVMMTKTTALMTTSR